MSARHGAIVFGTMSVCVCIGVYIQTKMIDAYGESSGFNVRFSCRRVIAAFCVVTVSGHAARSSSLVLASHLLLPVLGTESS